LLQGLTIHGLGLRILAVVEQLLAHQHGAQGLHGFLGDCGFRYEVSPAHEENAMSFVFIAAQ
jgi:hypothetical protein